MSHPLKILLVDDEISYLESVKTSLELLGNKVITAMTASGAVEELRKTSFDLVLTDYQLPDATGEDLLVDIKVMEPELMVVVMTAFANFESAVRITKKGAFDYLAKPVGLDELKHILKKVSEIIYLRRENKLLKGTHDKLGYFEGFTSNAMRHLEDFIRKIAKTEATILITGESGTGKSFLARQIHNLSEYSNGPYVEVHCNTLTESLIESQLFGAKKGSYTGAIKDAVGKIQLAEGGTIFLDEIGELTLSSQAKLLRFLQEKIIEPIGSNTPIEVHARVIAASNKNLEDMVEKGEFREDLYYRLNMFECILPSIRYRKEDIDILIKRFLLTFQLQKRSSLPYVIPDSLLQRLKDYDWPGNVRELRNTLERLCFLADTNILNENDLPENFGKVSKVHTPFHFQYPEPAAHHHTASDSKTNPDDRDNNTGIFPTLPTSNSTNSNSSSSFSSSPHHEGVSAGAHSGSTSPFKIVYDAEWEKNTPRHLKSIAEIEKEHIELVLREEKNLDRAAEILGITTVTLWRKRKQYNLP